MRTEPDGLGHTARPWLGTFAGLVAAVAVLNFMALFTFSVWQFSDLDRLRDLVVGIASLAVLFSARSAGFVVLAYVARRSRFALRVVAGGVAVHTVMTMVIISVSLSESSTAALGLIPVTLLDYLFLALTAGIAWGLPRAAPLSSQTSAWWHEQTAARRDQTD